MMTMREAKQRMSQNQMRLDRVDGTTELRVAFAEDGHRKAEKSAYYTDDLEDAVLTAAAMRRKRGPLLGSGETL